MACKEAGPIGRHGSESRRVHAGAQASMGEQA
eukprot:CAMPEP_0204573794 /NCGR_PEP_ID=MMETSP0661-20131031/40231_1 /ASSEMBLY_ACC=CAM_ASM_000606 /TAXON_ID=109239 /ORGANISM="Alexandrium margalefi, Strain AMGDE01CS-322" /LENGTH=31 /DNA_ID= /DNA_START= /DNA_END= /DNA_ORIENTATION=